MIMLYICAFFLPIIWHIKKEEYKEKKFIEKIKSLSPERLERLIQQCENHVKELQKSKEN